MHLFSFGSAVYEKCKSYSKVMVAVGDVRAKMFGKPTLAQQQQQQQRKSLCIFESCAIWMKWTSTTMMNAFIHIHTADFPVIDRFQSGHISRVTRQCYIILWKLRAHFFCCSNEAKNEKHLLWMWFLWSLRFWAAIFFRGFSMAVLMWVFVDGVFSSWF